MRYRIVLDNNNNYVPQYKRWFGGWKNFIPLEEHTYKRYNDVLLFLKFVVHKSNNNIINEFRNEREVINTPLYPTDSKSPFISNTGIVTSLSHLIKEEK